MFVWLLFDGSGSELGASEAFEERDDAEGWLGLSWASLAERGVEEVELVVRHADAGRDEPIYRMSLAER